ncbi:hypothetical protein FRB95_003993 [Tulasnella sp. JGI-2019a]|nr:hypothetical protein FRB95_003993 [Tulasnella sp. JGI-2019a]
MSAAGINHVEGLVHAAFTSDGPYDTMPRLMTSQDKDAFIKSLDVTDQFGQAQTARLWEERLLPKYPISPFFWIRVGDVRRQFGSSMMALEAYEKAQQIAEPGADPVYDLSLTAFRKLCEQAEEDAMYNWADANFAYDWIPMQQIEFPTCPEPCQSESLKSRWRAIQSDATDGNGVELYFRAVCVETNVIENIFQVSRNGTTEMVKKSLNPTFSRGTANSISLSSGSPIWTGLVFEPENSRAFLDTADIRCILQNARAALDDIFKMSKVTTPWTVPGLCKLHEKCMEASKFRTSFSRLPNGSLVNVKTKYLPTGRTRGFIRTNVTLNSYHGAIGLCPFQEVDEEFTRFVEMSHNYLSTYGDRPFALAAWLHFAFVTLHPFQDGNGRMCRLLASLPLIRAGLPPLCIPTSLKGKYIAALDHLRTTLSKPEFEPADFEPLMQVFAEGMTNTISWVERRPSPSSTPSSDTMTYNSLAPLIPTNGTRKPIVMVEKGVLSQSLSPAPLLGEAVTGASEGKIDEPTKALEDAFRKVTLDGVVKT